MSARGLTEFTFSSIVLPIQLVFLIIIISLPPTAFCFLLSPLTIHIHGLTLCCIKILSRVSTIIIY